MKRIFSLALACALSLSMLTACGGGSESGSASGSLPGGSASQSGSGSLSTPDASLPGGSSSEESGSLPGDQASLTLNKSDITLKSAGASYQLKFTLSASTDGPVVFSSSDESVAVVDADGSITAVAPGTATITASYGDLTAQCIVRCRWEEKGDASTGAGSAGSDSGSATSVDLNAFYQTIFTDPNNTPAMMELDAEMAEGLYPGITTAELNQRVMYMPMMTAVACEIVMVECANASDVANVKAILQSRIDSQIANHTNYPAVIEAWETEAQVVVNGNYVALFVVSGMTDQVVERFNDLF